jgi:hypothetical protein
MILGYTVHKSKEHETEHSIIEFVIWYWQTVINNGGYKCLKGFYEFIERLYHGFQNIGMNHCCRFPVKGTVSRDGDLR